MISVSTLRRALTSAGDRLASQQQKLRWFVGGAILLVSVLTSTVSPDAPPQFAALAKLHDVGETSQNQLGTLVAMDAATIKGVIDRLKARGLVDLSRHDADKRRLMVSLTAEGRSTIERLIPLAQQATQETLAPLTDKEIATFLKLLAKLA